MQGSQILDSNYCIIKGGLSQGHPLYDYYQWHVDYLFIHTASLDSSVWWHPTLLFYPTQSVYY